MKRNNFIALFMMAIFAIGLLTTTCMAAVSTIEAKPPPPPPPPPKPNKIIAVGSYGGYWGLNDWFMGLMSQYFTLDEMKDIDRQIQAISGITNYGYNYNSEGGNGYYYDSNKDSWNYSGGRAGKHYGEIYDTGFWIDIETGQVIGTFSSRQVAGGARYSSLTGKKVKVNGSAYQVVGARNWSPIVLDLNSDGVVDTNRNIWTPHAPRFFKERTAFFDLTGDKRQEYCEWLGGSDGLLVTLNKDGSVTDANNLFGTAGGYRDGYEKMSIILDKDKNGWVEGEELEGLYIWKDKNSDAVCDKGELTNIKDLGVTKISTSHKNFNSVYYRNGKKFQTWDWWPTGYELMRRK